jgi:hypothetical protein
MKQLFYVKNDLSEREDVKGIIQRPIRSRFSIRRPSIAGGNKTQACLMSFNTVCTYIGTNDLVQEHIAYKVWPLVNGWEMPKETTAGSSEGGLVFLKYIYRYKSQFGEPNDGWLEAIEVASDELLGTYTKAKDEAMNTAFGARGKRRLNKVFDVIEFIYPDYCFPAQKQRAKRKIGTTTSSAVPKPKRAKVLTRRPKLHSLEKASALPATEKMEIVEYAEATPSTSKIIPAITAESYCRSGRRNRTKELKDRAATEIAESPTMTGLLKLATATTATPRKGRRMVSVLDAVLKSSKVPTPASTKASEDNIEKLVVVAAISSTCAEAGPSGSMLVEQARESLPQKLTLPIPKASSRDDFGYIVRHASGKELSIEHIAEVQYYAKDLK